MKKIFFFITLNIIGIAVYVKRQSFNKKDSVDWACLKDLIHNVSICNPLCPYGSFALPGMLSCHRWLNCEDKITLLSVLSFSVVKTVYMAKWKDHEVVLSVLSSEKYIQDFKHNLFMIKSLASHHHVVQLLGYCNNSMVTKYYELGNAWNVHHHMMHSLRAYDNMKVRLNLCVSYVSVIHFLHSSPLGVRVMCDSNTLEKTLSQYLLTVNLKLVINDLDATPQVDNSSGGVHCGNRALTGALLAPEQIWPYADKEFDVMKMPFYDEKTDIWKIPDICSWFLGTSSDADVLKYKLFTFHKLCKSYHPSKRPSAGDAINVYEKLLSEL